MMNVEQLIATAKKYYPETGSHGWEHIEAVMERARRLLGRQLWFSELAAIVFHDASLKDGDRETHEIDSGVIARRELAGEVSNKDLDDIVDAIACHRASYCGYRMTRLANLLATADRNPPDAPSMYRRSYLYAIEHGDTPRQAAEHAVVHIKEKYGRCGYAYRTVPELYMTSYRGKLDETWATIDAMTADDVLRLVAA